MKWGGRTIHRWKEGVVRVLKIGVRGCSCKSWNIDCVWWLKNSCVACLYYGTYTAFVFHSYFAYHLTPECLTQKMLETQFSSLGRYASICFLAHSISKKSARKRRSTTQTLQRHNWQNIQKCSKNLIFPNSSNESYDSWISTFMSTTYVQQLCIFER